jgi:hypothetical protein
VKPENIQLLALVLSTCAFLVSLFVALRAGKWRESDDAKSLIGRVSGLETRITVLETEMKDLPTKEDVARLEGKIQGVCDIGQRTEKAVDRIESYMMERA